jgi:hypothetical protein
MQLAWAENVVRETNGRILILAPLAVAPQTIREGVKFGIEVHRAVPGKDPKKGISVTNYQQLNKYNPSDFDACVGDESGAIKHSESETRKDVTEFMRKMKYRLLCTATPSPNDYTELGTSSEALGQMGHADMLTTFFKNNEESLNPIWWGSKWRMKMHAEVPFWRWVCSWARALQKPSDLGFDDEGFKLPPLEIKQHVVEVPNLCDGTFDHVAVTLNEQRVELKATLRQRCEKVAELVQGRKPSVVWCHLNPEGDLLEKLIPGAVQVSGSDSDEFKEETFLAFADGQIDTLVTKPKIGCWGLNWQHCASMTFFPSDSWESYYQAVRRCWRYGQKRKVLVDVITTPGMNKVLRNLQRKDEAAKVMFQNLVKEMNNVYSPAKEEPGKNGKMEIPRWL